MHRTAKKQNRILAVCLAGGFTTMLDNSVLNIAVPALRSSLEASATQIQWIVAGYSLAFGLALIPGGRLGDLRGRKQFFVAGIALFVVAGLFAAAATDPWLLVVLRLLQGAGAGLVNSQMIGTLQDVFTGPARTRALGLYQVTCAVAIALGPPLGGALIALAGPEWGWRLAFLISAPSGLATLVLAVRHLPRPAPRTTPAPGTAPGAARGLASLDPLGLLLTAAITVAVMLPFVTSAPLPAQLGLGAAAVAMAVLLARWQRHCVATGRQPLIHPALPRSAPYTLGTLTAMAQFGASLAGGLVLVMFLQDGLGLSPLAAAAVTLPSAVAMAVVSSFAWRAVQRFGAHLVPLGLTLALAAVLLSGLAALWTTGPWLPVLLGLGQLCTGAAAGLVVSPNQAQVLRYAPAEAAGVAGGILQMSQRIAAAVGISAISGIYLNSSAATPGTAYFQAALACTAVFALALLLSVLANRSTPDQPAPAPAPAPRPEVREGAVQGD
ncbi:MFS transporter [Kitasatospora sp. NPDC051853]|uniref:MFS transporter n=1 Tax=Kitasatospora sp. NPDC051853 TaxID=3364058 RepID=UPI0037A1BF33